MKTTRVLLAAFVATVFLSGFTQGGITLRRTLTEGDVDKYTFEILSSQLVYSDMMGSEMPIEITTSGKVAIKTGKVDEEKQEANVEIHVTDLKYDLGMVGGMMGDAELPREMKFTGKMNQFGEITNVNSVGGAQPGGMAGGMMMMFGGGASANMMFPSIKFPEKSLRIGDTWEIPIPANPMLGVGDEKMTATIESQREEAGVPIYVIRVTAKHPTNVDMARAMEAQGGAGGNEMAGMLANMKISGSMDSITVVWVERESGRIIKQETLQKTKQKIDGGMFTADVNGTTTVKMVRIAE
jgi:hypothetical protein